MKRLFFVLAAVATCSIANAGVIVQLPTRMVQTPLWQYDFDIDVGLFLDGETSSQPLVGYQLTLKVTTIVGSGLTIVGAGTGCDQPENSVIDVAASYSVQNDGADNALYTFQAFLPSGTATITDASSLLRIKARLAPGATGVYAINPVNGSSSHFNSNLYSGFDEQGAPIPIPDVSFRGATVFVVPEPSSLGLLAAMTLGAGTLTSTVIAGKARTRRRHGSSSGYASIARNCSNR